MRIPFYSYAGIKRDIVVDTQGLPHSITITTANISDRVGALLVFKKHIPALLNVKSILVDGGYTGDPFAESVKELFNATVQVAKRSELPTFKVIPQRWVVERSFALLDKSRRL